MGRLIGLGGKLRAGKDVVGDYLETEHGYVKLGMSDALNEALLALNPWIPYALAEGGGIKRYQELHDAVGYVEAKKNPEVRRLLQALGTEVGREMIDPDVWVRIAEKKILEHWEAGRDVVITAVRFPNEVEMIDRLGGFTVWVERPDADRGAPEGLESHASETSVSQSDFQYVLSNDGTIPQLHKKVEKRLVDSELERLARERPKLEARKIQGGEVTATSIAYSNRELSKYVAKGFNKD